MMQTEHRLGTLTRPTRYDLVLTADPEAPTFAGHLRIALACSGAGSNVTLNAKGLRIQWARLEQDGASASCQIHMDAQEERVSFGAPFAPGPATLEIRFEGDVGQAMAGLYLSKDGEDVCLATQCEATDARAIFPCFDEPAFKAVMALTVVAPAGLQVLANGREAQRLPDQPRAGQTTWVFEPTPPISSYLFAVAVGRFSAGPATKAGSTDFRVWAMGGRQSIGTYGRDVAARLLPWFEEYFAQPYAFGKYDQVAVPSFAFGAMENPGLVVFRPSLVLVDPESSSWDDRRDVALVVAHEFAHMWFGDLVTMAWWDDLWLNEAFAEWMAHKATADLAPDMDVWSRFRSRASSALATDTLERTHAIYHDVQTPKEAAEMFDAITYGKGSAVMRMLESYLGPQAFRQGLRTYMQEFRFGNARGPDLWRHLGTASGQDVAGIMGDWVGKRGHPEVTATWSGGSLRLSQRRARSSPLADPPATTWRIPMVVRYRDDAGTHSVPVLVARESDTVPLRVSGNLHWLWPNAGDVGFFQCMLDGELAERAVAAAGELEPAERMALLRDAWLGVRAGAPAEPFLRAFALLLDGKAPYDVVQQQVGFLREFERLLESHGETEALAALRAWIVARLQGDLGEVEGRKPEAGADPRGAMRQAALLRAVAGIGRAPAAVAAARALAQRERGAPGEVDATLAGTAVAVEAALGDRATLDLHVATATARRAAGASPQDVERYLYTLGSFRAPELVQQVLATLHSGSIAPQAVGPILRSMLAETHSGRAAWIHTKTNWRNLVATLGEPWVANLVEAAGELPVDLAADVQGFLDSNLGGMAQQAYGRAKERLQQRAELLPRLVPAVAAWSRSLMPAQHRQAPRLK